MGRAVVNALLALYEESRCKTQTECSSDRKRPLRLALLTPYMDSLHKTVADFLRREIPTEKLAIVAEDNLSIDRDYLVCRVTPTAIQQRCKEMVTRLPPDGNSKIDAVFVCCSAFNVTGGRTESVNFIQNLEQDLGIPVLTSSQCLIWDSLHAGVSARQSLSLGIDEKLGGSTNAHERELLLSSEVIQKQILKFGKLFKLSHPISSSTASTV